MAKNPGYPHRPPAAEAAIRVPVASFEPDATPPKAPVGPMPAVTAWKDELTRELLEQLVVAAAVGGFKKQCALACGVKPATLEWWLSEGMREDAEPLWQELSARFQATVENASLGLVEAIRRAATAGEWQAAGFLLKQRDPLWRGSEKFTEPETAPSATSLAERKREFVEQLREARLNPLGGLADSLREAGFPLQEPERPESDELHALLSRGKLENPEP